MQRDRSPHKSRPKRGLSGTTAPAEEVEEGASRRPGLLACWAARRRHWLGHVRGSPGLAPVGRAGGARPLSSVLPRGMEAGDVGAAGSARRQLLRQHLAAARPQGALGRGRPLGAGGGEGRCVQGGDQHPAGAAVSQARVSRVRHLPQPAAHVPVGRRGPRNAGVLPHLLLPSDVQVFSAPGAVLSRPRCRAAANRETRGVGLGAGGLAPHGIVVLPLEGKGAAPQLRSVGRWLSREGCD
mmetsp:Transcript_146271/g.469167  ORF Transcript_146271/g.469167 Transcript_146271/m.469167 type:complete len:240 (+) Transcript_146271:741-1460(+)